jgi:hypothetical protein
LVTALSSLRERSDTRRWSAVHVLYAECRCSRRILEHLARSERPAQAQEKLLLVGDSKQQADARTLLDPRQFCVSGTTPDALLER